MMSDKKNIAKIIAIILVVSSIIPMILFSASASVPRDYDLSRPGSLNTVTLSGADILERLLGEQLGEAERLYLVSYGDYEIKYDDGITTSYVEASCINGFLSVSAYEYSYSTEDGATVTWTPVRAQINGQIHSLTKNENAYVTTFEGVSVDDDTAAVSVVYTLGVEISAEVVNELAALAYNDAPRLKEEREAALAEYEQALGEYNSAKAEYDAYVVALEKYEDDLKLYNDYLSAKRVYDLSLKKYNQYLAAKAIYDTKLAAYREYEEKLLQYEEDFKRYSEYRNAYTEYENDLAEYNSVVADLNKCRAQLAIIESTMTPVTDLNRYIYSDVCVSTLVDVVLEQRDAYEKTGRYDVSPAALDLAEECTGILRRLLGEYFSLETEEAKYNYYSANYESFKYGFTGLFQSLYYFTNVKNSVLMGDLETMLKLTGKGVDKIPKLMILIAMLYTVSSAITDGPVYTISPSLVSDKDPSYKRSIVTFDNFKCYYESYKKIMGTAPYLKDTDTAFPVSGGFPSVSVEPTPPSEVKEPTAPTYVSEPVAPTEVKNPGEEPTELDNPGDPPETVDAPTEPKAPVYTEAQLALIDAYERGEISQRDVKFDTDPILALEISLNKRFLNVEEVTVKFHYAEGEEPWVTRVDKGTLADYGGPVPYIPEDDRAIYTFVGWQTAEGVLVDLSSATEDLELYPKFEETIKTYDVTFIVDGKRETVTLPYGELPLYTGMPEKPSTDDKRYVFEGWSPEIAPVTTDATYTATFREEDIFVHQDGVTAVFDGEDFIYKVSFSTSNTVNIASALEMSLIESDIIIETRSARVEIDPLAVAVLKALGASEITVNVNTPSSVSKNVEIVINGANPTRAATDFSSVSVKVTLRAPIGTSERMRVRYKNGEGVYQFTECTTEDKNVSFDAVPGVAYSVGSEYLVHTVSTESASISVQAKNFFAGDTVEISTVIPDGKRMVKLVYRYGDGKEVKITGSKFTMPASDVTVMAVVEQITYKVTFISDGAIVKTYRCPHGELATAPAEAPKKASDGEYTYTFIGWSAEFNPITEDTEYVAVYEKKAIEKTESAASSGINLYQLITIAKAVIITLAVLLGIWLISVIIRRLRGY